MATLLVVALCFVGGFVPFVQADAVLFAAALVSRTGSLAILVVAAGVAQVMGKLVVFVLTRRCVGGARRLLAGRAPARLPTFDRVCDRLPARLRGAGALAIALSAATSVPPFYATTCAAAATHISLSRFCAAALAGRTVRAAAIVLLPRLLLGG